MRRVFGPRTAVEAVFLVAVPVVAWRLGLGSYAIVAASAIGYLLVLLVEGLIWRRTSAPAPAEAPAEEAPEAVHEPVPAQEAVPAPEAEPQPRMEPEPPPQAEPEPEPAPQPEPESKPAPAPEPAPERILTPVPDLEPEPEPEPEPDAEPEPRPAATVVRLETRAEPRCWNLWDLERANREGAGEDALRDEERAFLLVYLREFADPDGRLPVDFDLLVRDSFADLVEAM